MTGRTNRYGLTTLGQGDVMAADGYKFGVLDREAIDWLLAQGAEAHHHNAQSVGLAAPAAALNLALQSTGGALPPGTRIYYKFTWVQGGLESTASPEAYIDTPAVVVTPGSPTIVGASSTGTLSPGTYYYVVTAYKSANTLETLASNPNFVALTGTTSQNKATLTMPSLPSGATGFNIYVRKPGQSKYFYQGSTTGSTFVHDGSTAQDCDRSTPTRNATNSSNSVIVSMPGATPSVPGGVTWRLYRTYSPGNYIRSLLHDVVETVTEGSSVVTPTYTDIGLSTTNGNPPTVSLTVTNPSKINLATETQGSLDATQITGIPVFLHLRLPGLVTVGQSVQWLNNYGAAAIIEVEKIDLSLRHGTAPASQAVIVDLFRGSTSLSPVYTDLFASTPSGRPRIAVGDERSAISGSSLGFTVSEGQTLSFRVAQAGGGATPGDYDLTISVWLKVVPT